MHISVFVFNGVATRDILGPVGTLQAADEVTAHLFAATAGTVFGFEPLHAFNPEQTLDQVESTDLLLIPGGLGSIQMMHDGNVLQWLKRQVPRSMYVLSVSTGSLLLAAAGILKGHEAAGHWLAHDLLETAGTHAADDAVRWDGKFVTTSGAVAAIEVAAELAERIKYGTLPDES
jgi:putative intracellular protease/amidase